MPNYLYRCTQAHDSEHFFNIGTKPATLTCHCGKKAKNIIVMPPVQFKGEGFTRAANRKQLEALKGKTFVDSETEKMYKENNLLPKEDIIIPV